MAEQSRTVDHVAFLRREDFLSRLRLMSWPTRSDIMDAFDAVMRDHTNLLPSSMADPQDLATWLKDYLGRMYLSADTEEHLTAIAAELARVTAERDALRRKVARYVRHARWWMGEARCLGSRRSPSMMADTPEKARALLARYETPR